MSVMILTVLPMPTVLPIPMMLPIHLILSPTHFVHLARTILPMLAVGANLPAFCHAEAQAITNPEPE